MYEILRVSQRQGASGGFQKLGRGEDEEEKLSYCLVGAESVSKEEMNYEGGRQ